MTTKKQVATLGSVSVGAKFIYRTLEILGPDGSTVRKPPYEGQVLTVVGFKPRYKNNVLVQESSGKESLMPLYVVEKALSLKALQICSDGSASV